MHHTKAFDRSVWQRMLVMLAALGFWFLTFAYVKPLFVDFFLKEYIPVDPNQKKLFNHIFVYSLAPGVLCGLGWYWLSSKRALRGPNLGHSPAYAILTGIIWALIFSLFLVGIIFLLDPKMVGFHAPNIWNEIGNLFSNTYEEIQYRGLIYLSALACFRSKYAAAFLSSIIFAWTHTQYPLVFQLLVAIMGCFSVFVFEKTENFLSPVSFHIGVDIIASYFLLS